MPARLPICLQVEVVHDASPSGIAVDPSRASIYYTSAERGAGLTWSNYDGRYPPPKQVIPQGEKIFFEPVAVALNPADGSVYVVQANTYVEGCDPTSNAGHGAVTCDDREQGRISRVSLPPKMHVHCMCTACRCMCTACALHVHCMRTACALHVHCMHPSPLGELRVAARPHDRRHARGAARVLLLRPHGTHAAMQALLLAALAVAAAVDAAQRRARSLPSPPLATPEQGGRLLSDGDH